MPACITQTLLQLCLHLLDIGGQGRQVLPGSIVTQGIKQFSGITERSLGQLNGESAKDDGIGNRPRCRRPSLISWATVPQRLETRQLRHSGDCGSTQAAARNASIVRAVRAGF